MDWNKIGCLVGIGGLLSPILGNFFKKIRTNIILGREKLTRSFLSCSDIKKQSLCDAAEEMMFGRKKYLIFHWHLRKIFHKSEKPINTLCDILNSRMFLPGYAKFAEKTMRILARHDGNDYPFAGFGYSIDFQKEDFYDERLHEYLNQTFEETLVSWSKNYYENDSKPLRDTARVLILGQMHPEVCKKLLMAICRVFGEGCSACVKERHKKVGTEIEFTFLGSSEKFKAFVKGLTARELLDFKVDIKYDYRIRYPYDFDVIVSSHYFQHKSLHHIEELLEGRLRKQFRLKPGGLLVWASAISRNQRKSEYVCEGFYPKETSLTNMNGFNHSKISHTPIGTFPASDEKLYYCRLENFVRMPTDMFRDFPFAIEFLPNKKKECISKTVSKLIDKFLQIEFEKFKHGNVRLTAVFKTEVEASRYGCSQYHVVNAEYRIDGCVDTVSFIVSEGEGRVLPDNKSSVRLTFYAANVIRNCSVLDFNDGECLDAIGYMLKDSNVKSMRLIRESKDVVRVLPEASDMVSKRYLLISRKNRNGGDECYYTILPKRRYIEKESYDRYLDDARMGDKNIEASLLKVSGCRKIMAFKPVSVTVLLPYEKLIGLFRTYGINICHGPFFYRCYHHFDSSWRLRLKLSGDNHQDVIRSLSEVKASVNRDVAFNKLQLSDRLLLLGSMNIHNVLIIGIKRKNRD